MHTASPAATSARTRPIRIETLSRPPSSQARTSGDVTLQPSASPSPAARATRLPRARGAGPRALARARRLPRVPAPPRGRAAVRLLRGAADRERPPGLPPRARARLQGHLPPLQDDARLLQLPQGRLGLPRPAGGDRGAGEAR